MAISKVDIINKALTLVGANPIISIDDNTNNARVMSRCYEISLRNILTVSQWNFAVKRALLSVSADVLTWYDTGEVYVYQKPTDIVRVFGVNDSSAIWREEGEYIISDTAGLGIRYVYYLDTPSKFTPTFTSAFIDLLCSDAAYMIVNSAALGQTYYAKYEKTSLPRAMSVNSQTGIQQAVRDEAWELAKYSDTQVNA
jgi:hypothetical protein